MPAWSILYVGLYLVLQMAGTWRRLSVWKEGVSWVLVADVATSMALAALFISYWQADWARWFGKAGVMLFLPASFRESLTFACAIREARQYENEMRMAPGSARRVLFGLGVLFLPVVIVAGAAALRPWIG